MRRAHVLVAEDEPHIGRLIAMKLESGPFRVTRADDGAAALAALAAHDDFELLILDLMMPHVSGLDVLASARAGERWRTLPCIVLTAIGHDAEHRRAMELGATEFLTKPFSPKRLFARAADLTGQSVAAAPGAASP
ncbi:MAG: response regulator [Gemmatimonadetes bacterium]|nr:response regulator [Gemmatimonadota bacterium]